MSDTHQDIDAAVRHRTAELMRSNEALRADAARLRAESAKLGDRLAVLKADYQVDRDAHRAALNLIEDAETARRAAERETEVRRQSEAALSLSEQRLQLALDAAAMGTFIWYPQEDRTEPDVQMMALFGLPPDGSLTLKTALETMIHQKDAARYADAVARSCDPLGDGMLREDIRIILPDGSLRWLAITGNVQFGREPRQAVRMAGTALDITVRKATEEALRQNEARQAFLLALSDQLRPIASAAEVEVIASRALGEYLKVDRINYAEVENGNFIVATGYCAPRVSDIDGHHLMSNFGPHLQASLMKGNTVAIGDVHADASLSTPQKAAYDEVGVRSFVAVPLLKGGTLVAVLGATHATSRPWSHHEIGLIEDMAERTWAAVARARAEETAAADLRDMQLLRDVAARLLTESETVAIYEEVNAVARELTKADAGTVQILDAATEELVIASTYGFPESRDRFERVEAGSKTSCGMALSRGERILVDFDDPALDDPKGDLRWHVEAGYRSAQSTPLISRTGRPIGMLSTHWHERHRPTDRELRFIDLLARQTADIIELRQSEHSLREANAAAALANKSKDRFLAVLSHELRTPLTPVTLVVGEMLDDPSLSADMLENLAMIRRNIDVQARLIDDLLDVTRLKSSKIILKPQEVDVNEIVQQVCGICASLADERHIHIETHLAPDMCKLHADPVRLQQALWNILKNAIKFTMSHGHISITTTHLDGGGCEVRVQDNGIGMKPEMVDRVFDVFEQGDPAITRQFGGLGLGLAITKALVELHGGHIRAESDGPGHGTRFVMELPK